MRRTIAVSVDLDEIGCYHRIHGLPPPDEDAAHAVYGRALVRFVSLFDALGIRATFFAIGEDLSRADARERLADLARAGHEIGNHTMTHPYDLVRRSDEEIRGEVVRGADAIEQATGMRPVGFRAPGYHVTPRVLSAAAEAGASYDSSLFPSAPYFAAKAIALGAMRLVGRRSASILGTPGVLFANAWPHRVGALVEIPIGVVPVLGIPFIGTTLTLAGEAGARALAFAMTARPFVNLELHGIDLCDADEDGLGALRPHQPDLRRPLAAKEASIRAAIETVLARGYEPVLLRDVSL